MKVQDQTVGSLVTRPLVTVHPEDTLRALAETMSEESIGAVVVRGERPPSAAGARPRGIVSERDIVAAVAQARNLDVTRAEDVMTMSLASASPDDSLGKVAALMLDNEIRHLVLVSDGVATGLVSERDVLRAMQAAAAEPAD